MKTKYNTLWHAQKTDVEGLSAILTKVIIMSRQWSYILLISLLAQQFSQTIIPPSSGVDVVPIFSLCGRR